MLLTHLQRNMYNSYVCYLSSIRQNILPESAFMTQHHSSADPPTSLFTFSRFGFYYNPRHFYQHHYHLDIYHKIGQISLPHIIYWVHFEVMTLAFEDTNGKRRVFSFKRLAVRSKSWDVPSRVSHSPDLPARLSPALPPAPSSSTSALAASFSCQAQSLGWGKNACMLLNLRQILWETGKNKKK